MTTPAGRPPGRKTYTRLAAGRRVPLEYELVSTDLHYNHPMRFELPAANPVVAWYYRYREGSALQARDWERFSDPRRTTYRAYTSCRTVARTSSTACSGRSMTPDTTGTSTTSG